MKHRPSSLSSTRHVHAIAPRAAERPEHDFYKTPSCAIDAFLDAHPVSGVVWDPACGDGQFERALARRGVRCRSTDLADYGHGRSGVDFFAATPRFKFDVIMTNPPFGKVVLPFARRSLELAPTVILLARLLWLEGSTKRAFFEKSPLEFVYVHSRRINVSRNGEDWGDGGWGGMIAFAWYVWRRGYRGEPKLRWIA